MLIRPASLRCASAACANAMSYAGETNLVPVTIRLGIELERYLRRRNGRECRRATQARGIGTRSPLVVKVCALCLRPMRLPSPPVVPVPAGCLGGMRCFLP